MDGGDRVQHVDDGAPLSNEEAQLAGMAVMLTVTRDYLPDDVLQELVARLGGAGAYVQGVLAIAFPVGEAGVAEGLIEGARDVLHRLRHRARHRGAH